MKREQIIRQLKGVEELETIEPLENIESGYYLDGNNKCCDEIEEIEPSGEPSQSLYTCYGTPNTQNYRRTATGKHGKISSSDFDMLLHCSLSYKLCL
jgi:hypothetical protein